MCVNNNDEGLKQRRYLGLVLAGESPQSCGDSRGTRCSRTLRSISPTRDSRLMVKGAIVGSPRREPEDLQQEAHSRTLRTGADFLKVKVYSTYQGTTNTMVLLQRE